MASPFLLDRAGVERRLDTRYRHQRRAWLSGGGGWPLVIGLGPPSERQSLEHLPRVRAWLEAWDDWSGPGAVRWGERRWPSLGVQRVPEALVLPDADAVARYLGQEGPWRRARARFEELAARWPVLSESLPRHFEVLARWPDAEFRRLQSLVEWLHGHPDAGVYIRQLPVPGVDSKWFHRHRALVAEWLGTLRGLPGERDIHALTGLRRLPVMLRLRLLDPVLRARVGGLGEITSPVDGLAGLDLPLRRLFIVENLQTGLAFEDLPRSAVFMGQGYAVEPFARLPWLNGPEVIYWGDLDTHGLAILDRLRGILPGARSLLMNQETLLAHRALWGEEKAPAEAADLPRLNGAEAALYRDLRQHRWGPRLRLEQERIPWDYAWPRLNATAEE